MTRSTYTLRECGVTPDEFAEPVLQAVFVSGEETECGVTSEEQEDEEPLGPVDGRGHPGHPGTHGSAWRHGGGGRMAVSDGERLLDKLRITDGRRCQLWERAERMRIGVDCARAVRAALVDERARPTSVDPA